MSSDPIQHDPHAHLCSDHAGEGPTVWDLPVPQSLKREWLELETRRHFLGRTAHGLGAIALGSLLKGSLPAAAAAATSSSLNVKGRPARSASVARSSGCARTRPSFSA